MPQQFREFKRPLPYVKGSLFAQIVIFRIAQKGSLRDRKRPVFIVLYV